MNAPRPHDLLWGMPVSGLPADAPQWAQDVLASGRPVVVRRATCEDGWVAVGLRGQGRAQRLGALMCLADVQHQQGPEALRVNVQSPWPALQALASVTPVLQASGLAWGPTGGVGYQLASGIEVVHADSDLDLLLRTPLPMARAHARGCWISSTARRAVSMCNWKLRRVPLPCVNGPVLPVGCCSSRLMARAWSTTLGR